MTTNSIDFGNKTIKNASIDGGFTDILYFKTGAGASVTALSSWYKDRDFTIPATTLPTENTFVVLSSKTGLGEVDLVGATLSVYGAQLNNVAISNGTLKSLCTLQNGSAVYSTGFVVGDCVFNDSASNGGTITGNCIFNDASFTASTINGDCVFKSSSQMKAGTINGAVTLYNSAQLNKNAGPVCTVNGDCFLHDSSALGGDNTDGPTINGNVTLYDLAMMRDTAVQKTLVCYGNSKVNRGTCSANRAEFWHNSSTDNNANFYCANVVFNDNAAHNSGGWIYVYQVNNVNNAVVFNNSSYATGPISGNVIFTASVFNKNPHLLAYTSPSVYFTSTTPVVFSLTGSQVWGADVNASAANWLFAAAGPSWTFAGTASLAATITGNATFNGGSFNDVSGVVDGNATFNNTSRNDGDVTGTATFNNAACNTTNGTAGTFVPNPPPACPQ